MLGHVQPEQAVTIAGIRTYWPEMLECLESDPDQTSLELLAKIMTKHPDAPLTKQLRTLQRRVKVWRQDAIQRLICQMQEANTDVSATATVAS